MEKYKEEVFVFVVCGGREHIDTLHFSLKALQKFSAKRIIVVTDSTRNEVSVIHSEIIDIKTPENFDHHQASIFLKTGLHKFLPKGNLYCYLDTDVVALSTDVDTIFEQYQSPITFCTDHCTIDEFSPNALLCGCLQAFQNDSPKPYFFYHDFKENVLPKLLYIDKCIAEIEKRVTASKASKWLYQWHKFKYNLPTKFYHLDRDFKMEKVTGLWYDNNNQLLSYEENAKDDILYVTQKTGFNYDSDLKQWFRNDGSSLTRLGCSHLTEMIEKKFGVCVQPQNWQHWNGGVFLFDDKSTEFLERWHISTLDIFKDESWKTRDQGTLIATVWKFNLQNHPTLPLVYNLIADYHNKSIEYQNQLTFFIGDGKKLIKPHFIHVYHHWGDKDWNLWSDIVKHIEVE